MLLSFSVSNFRSFWDQQTLSMIASPRQPDHQEHLTELPDGENKALPIAAIYGANGAGKSNLVKALSYLQKLVITGTEPKKSTGRTPFLLNKEGQSQPSEFSIQFVVSGEIYSFGCRVRDAVIDAEWLVLVVNGSEQIVYERITDSNGDVRIEPGPVLTENALADSVKVIALAKVGVLENQLFLHAVLSNLKEQDQGSVLSGVLRWFSKLVIVEPHSQFQRLAGWLDQEPSRLRFADDFLRKAATGVDRLIIGTVALENGVLGNFAPELQSKIEAMGPGDVASIPQANGTEMIVEKGEGTVVKLRTIKAAHTSTEGKPVEFPFSEESDGTQRITHLLPALYAICEGDAVFVIDEIDRSLHPLLAKWFVRSFLKEGQGKGGQLIFTTHDTAFLDLSLLRRDEIWFADKLQNAGATDLYSLSDYKVRTDLRIDKAYLEGRFNAVPPIGNEFPEWVGKIMNELHPQDTLTEAV